MAAIPYRVAESFRAQKADRAGAFVSTGAELFSYGMRLAHWEDGRIVLDYTPGNAPTVTTDRHMRAIESVLDWNGAHPAITERRR